ncbi:hypothetical protein CC79DRAFT_477751 [Sarocladium strictum]
MRLCTFSGPNGRIPCPASPVRGGSLLLPPRPPMSLSLQANDNEAPSPPFAQHIDECHVLGLFRHFHQCVLPRSWADLRLRSARPLPATTRHRRFEVGVRLMAGLTSSKAGTIPSKAFLQYCKSPGYEHGTRNITWPWKASLLSIAHTLSGY